MTQSNTAKTYHYALGQARDILGMFTPEQDWAVRRDILDTYKVIESNLEKDIKSFKRDLSPLISVNTKAEKTTKLTIKLIKKWYKNGNPPSLIAMCLAFFELLDISTNNEMEQALFIAGACAELPNANFYHNTLHFKKVLLQTMRLIAKHQHLNKEAFDDNEMVLLCLAACIHDLGHNGNGNGKDESYIQGHLERQSYFLLVKYFNAIGFEDKIKFETFTTRLRVLLLCTDVSTNGEHLSFAEQMNAVYKDQSATTDPEISSIKKDAALLQLAMYLHEGDIATSAGLSYEITSFETLLFYKETQNRNARPSDVKDFLDKFALNGFLSDAAQSLYTDNIQSILKQTKKAITDGDEAFDMKSFKFAKERKKKK